MSLIFNEQTMKKAKFIESFVMESDDKALFNIDRDRLPCDEPVETDIGQECWILDGECEAGFMNQNTVFVWIPEFDTGAVVLERYVEAQSR
jgi:hypothetical protein